MFDKSSKKLNDIEKASLRRERLYKLKIATVVTAAIVSMVPVGNAVSNAAIDWDIHNLKHYGSTSAPEYKFSQSRGSSAVIKVEEISPLSSLVSYTNSDRDANGKFTKEFVSQEYDKIKESSLVVKAYNAYADTVNPIMHKIFGSEFQQESTSSYYIGANFEYEDVSKQIAAEVSKINQEKTTNLEL